MLSQPECCLRYDLADTSVTDPSFKNKTATWNIQVEQLQCD